MSDSVPLPPPGFDELSSEEQLRYLEALWQRISTRPELVPVPAWHREVLRDRVAESERAPDDVRPWSEVREELDRVIDESGE